MISVNLPGDTGFSIRDKKHPKREQKFALKLAAMILDKMTIVEDGPEPEEEKLAMGFAVTEATSEVERAEPFVENEDDDE